MVCKVCGKMSVGTSRCLFCGIEHESADKSKSGSSAVRPKFCPDCGTKIQDGDTVCSNCGLAVSVRSAYDGKATSGSKGSRYNADIEAREREKARIAEKKEKSNKRLSIAAVVFSCFILIVGIAACVFLGMFVKTSEYEYGKMAGMFTLMCNAYLLIPTLVMSLVSFVRAKRYSYRISYRISLIAIAIMLTGIALSLVGMIPGLSYMWGL